MRCNSDTSEQEMPSLKFAEVWRKRIGTFKADLDTRNLFFVFSLTLKPFNHNSMLSNKIFFNKFSLFGMSCVEICTWTVGT